MMQKPTLNIAARAAIVVAGVAMMSCGSHPSSSPGANRTINPPEDANSVKLADAAGAGNDAAPIVPIKSVQGIAVNFIKEIMPLGAVMNNAAFWKAIDEDVIDPRTRDLLWKNGLRGGIGKISDWPKYRATLDHENAVIDTGRFLVLPEFKTVDLAMTPEVAEEDLWVFNDHGLSGRTYFNCINRFNFSFQWAPRKENTVRMTICPSVFTSRQRMDYSLSAFPPPEELLQEENLYDLRLHVDVGPDEFFVLSPSPVVTDFDRIGSRFLVTNAGADRYEKVLILTPNTLTMRRARLASAATRPATTKPTTGK